MRSKSSEKISSYVVDENDQPSTMWIIEGKIPKLEDLFLLLPEDVGMDIELKYNYDVKKI